MTDAENHMVLPHADDDVEFAPTCWCGEPVFTDAPQRLGLSHLCKAHRKEKERNLERKTRT